MIKLGYFMSFVKGMYVILFALFFALQTPAYAESLNRVAATVNEEIITSHELDTRLHQILLEQPNIPGSKNALRHQVLDMLVLESIERQQSLKTGISVDEQTVDQLITTIAKNHQMTVPQWKETLLAQGMDLSAYREQVRLEAMRSRLYERDISSKIEVTPEEIQQFLRSPDGQARLGVLYRIGHILIALPKAPTTEQILATQAKAEKIVTDIKNGATFKEESTLYSQSKNALQGGDLGWRTTAQLPPMFLPFVVKMKLGDVSAPIRNASGFHIITLMDKKNASNTQAIRLNALYIPFTGHTPTEVSEFQSLSQKLAVGDANWADLTKKFPLKGHASVADWVEVDALPPEVQKRLDTLSDRSISEPIASSSGWYIIQVVERKSAPSQTEQATRWIAARKFEEALELWQRHARLEAHIIYHE